MRMVDRFLNYALIVVHLTSIIIKYLSMIILTNLSKYSLGYNLMIRRYSKRLNTFSLHFSQTKEVIVDVS